MLIHTVKKYGKEVKDRWGKGSTGESVDIRNVRIEPCEKVIRDKNSAEVQIEAILFYDCKNSRPKDINFERDEIVEFNGEKHKIKTVESLYDEKRLHHYEVGLIKGA